MASENTEKNDVETNVEQTEQRTDDYDGLARRIDDVLTKLDAYGSKLTAFIESVNTFMDAAGAGDTDGDSETHDDSDDTDDIDLETPIEELDFTID